MRHHLHFIMSNHTFKQDFSTEVLANCFQLARRFAFFSLIPSTPIEHFFLFERNERNRTCGEKKICSEPHPPQFLFLLHFSIVFDCGQIEKDQSLLNLTVAGSQGEIFNDFALFFRFGGLRFCRRISVN